MQSDEDKSQLLPDELKQIFNSMPQIAIAFSGGIDSRFLAYAAKICGGEPILLHGTGPHIPIHETDFAEKWAKKHNFKFYKFHYNPLNLPDVKANNQKRCYACKFGLFANLKNELKKNNITAQICDGSQKDDEKVFRPGMAALKEHKIKSPLALAGLGKTEVRLLARDIGLENWEQKARPCLLTRLAYNLTPEEPALKLVETCERKIENYLNKKNIKNYDFRLRLTPEPILQYSTEMNGATENAIKNILNKYGFKDALILKNESISGFFDRICVLKD